VKLSDFDYDLPPERIATAPAEPRDSARLLLLDRATGALRDHFVRDLPLLLAPGDLLVVNDTRVLHARLLGRRATGGRVELLLLRREPGGPFHALLRAHRSLRPAERIGLEGGMEAEILDRLEPGGPVWRVALRAPGPIEEAIERHGHVPLPPYIRRPDTAADRERYQTVFASKPGAAAAPTAGLHFTPSLLDALGARGIGVARLTLHVGYGTFQPIEAEDVEGHRLHEEEFLVPEETARAIRERRGRLVAVGTTTTRVLETLAARGGIRAASGRTDLFLHPGRPPAAIEGLLTNFHLPKSSLLLLVCGFAGREKVLAAYRHAVAAGYRFFSYGDAMLIL
jgi:S-adenosylmethionine:tRNA ribosyltransferase-isomerase